MSVDFGPDSDEEQPLEEHLGELKTRLLVTLGIVFVAALTSLPFSRRGLDLMVEKVATEGVGLAIYGPMEFVVVQIYFVLVFGLAVGTPVIIYEAYAFMAPGLYENERRFFLVSIPASVLLLSLGAALAWFLVIPQLAPTLMASGEEVARAAISLERVFSFVAGTMVLMGLVFQVPLLVGLAVKSGAATARSLLDRRIYVYPSVFFLTSLFSLDPTMATQIILTAVFAGLYEVSVRLAGLLPGASSPQGPG